MSKFDVQSTTNQGVILNQQDYNKILSYVPTVIEASSKGERSFDIFSRLLRERIVFIGEEIDDEMANSIVAQLLLLDSENPEKDIMLYINSPGGVITAGMAIYDTMQLVKADTERDHYLSAQEAVEYGLIDKVVTNITSPTSA